MTFLTNAEIASMRAQIAETLTDTCVIQSVSNVSDGAGGETPTWAAVSGGTVACRFDHPQQRNQIARAAGAEGFIAEFHLVLPYDAPVASNRRVIHNGNTYEIRRLADEGSILLMKKCYVSRVE